MAGPGDEVAGLGLRGGHLGAGHGLLAGGAGQADADLGVHVGGEAGAVEGARAGGAPHVGGTDVLHGDGHDRGVGGAGRRSGRGGLSGLRVRSSGVSALVSSSGSRGGGLGGGLLGLGGGGLGSGGRLRSRRGGGNGLHLRSSLGDPVDLRHGDLLAGGQGLASVGGEDADPGGHAGSLDGAGGGDLSVAGGVGSRSDHGQGEAGRSGDCQTAARGGSKVIQWGKGAGGFAVTCGGA